MDLEDGLHASLSCNESLADLKLMFTSRRLTWCTQRVFADLLERPRAVTLSENVAAAYFFPGMGHRGHGRRRVQSGGQRRAS